LPFAQKNKIKLPFTTKLHAEQTACRTKYLCANKYGEVHTGDAWLPARDRYCQNKTDMPVGLIIFGEK
jgi:hypothetical protein